MNKLNSWAAMGVGVLLSVSTSQAGIIGNPYPASPSTAVAQPFDSADRDLLTAMNRPLVDGGSLTNPVQPLKGVNAAIAEGVRSLDVRFDDPAGRVGMAPAAGSARRWFDNLLNRSDDSSPVSSVGVVPLDVELRDLVDHAEYVPEPVSIAWVVLGVIPFFRRSARRGHV